jgi:hypothetical protein
MNPLKAKNFSNREALDVKLVSMIFRILDSGLLDRTVDPHNIRRTVPLTIQRKTIPS